MPLCPNTFRRGSIYWWRRRFLDPASGQSRTIAFSLGVRDPKSARIIGARLNAEATLAAQRLESRMEMFEAVADVLASFAAWQPPVENGAFDPATRHREVGAGSTYTRADERAMLLAMARDADEKLTREALYNRSHGGIEEAHVVDAKAVQAELAIGFIYKLVAARGACARVQEADQVAMTARGLTKELVGFVAQEVAYHAGREWSISWTLGPDRAYFVRHLADAGIETQDGNIVALRAAYLQLFADLLFDAERRYRNARSSVDEVIASLRSAGASKLERLDATTMMQAPPLHEKSQLEPPPILSQSKGTGLSAAPSDSIEPGSERSFTGRVEALARRRERAKREGPDGWEPKTSNQHRSLARLFVKLAGTDDPTKMNQANVGAYRELLDVLPKNWGKSSQDQVRSIHEILASSEDMDEDEIGLSWGTINRHMTQLGNILTYLRSHGDVVGSVTDDMREKGEARERRPFTAEDQKLLFAAETWSSSHKVHGSQYFVPLIGKYMLPRLAEITGLLLEDIDRNEKFIYIRPNRIRGVKNKASIRRVPIMPEVERLGFFDYVETISKAGSDVLWPDLQLRGIATPMSNLYYKKWVETLRLTLPKAGAENKSFHSWRKGGNSEMAAANVNEALRYQILGHSYKDTNGKHYTDELSLESKRFALGKISISTAWLEAHKAN